MTITSAPESDAERAGEGDVSITIKGQTAAQMLARGDAKARELEELVLGLGQKLEGIEAALIQKSAEQERLDRLVQELQGKLTQLGGQMVGQGTELRGDLARLREQSGDIAKLREELNGQGDKLPRLQYKVEGLAMTVADIMRRLEAPPTEGDNGVGAASPQGGGEDAAGAATGAGRLSTFFTSTADRLRRLNLSVGLWSVAGALAALAAVATAWLST